MGSIARIMKATRMRLVGVESDTVSDAFVECFGLREGDYVRYSRSGEQWKHARIMAVDDVYINQGGGITAVTTVAPLLRGGLLGKTRSLMLVADANKRSIRGVGDVEVEVVSSSLKKFV